MADILLTLFLLIVIITDGVVQAYSGSGVDGSGYDHDDLCSEICGDDEDMYPTTTKGPAGADSDLTDTDDIKWPIIAGIAGGLVGLLIGVLVGFLIGRVIQRRHSPGVTTNHVSERAKEEASNTYESLHAGTTTADNGNVCNIDNAIYVNIEEGNAKYDKLQRSK